MNESRKHARRAAAAAERTRRFRLAEDTSPLSRAQQLELLEFVAEEVAAHGHSSSFEFVSAWLSARDIDEAPVVAFLRQHGVADDYSLLLSGDPFTLFGPSGGRRAWMPLERSDLEAPILHVDRQCRRSGCDHSTRFTRAFLSERGLRVGVCEMALLAQGGGCDCEVVLNVDPSAIYGEVAG